ncbi:MAG: hypothetical protein ACLT11_09920 [Blautia faecis]
MQIAGMIFQTGSSIRQPQ